jgi:hypothetical protein
MADHRRGHRPPSTTHRELYTSVIEHGPSHRQRPFVRLEPVADAPRMSTFLGRKDAWRVIGSRHNV